MTPTVEIGTPTGLTVAVDRLTALEAAWIEQPCPGTAADYLEAALALLDFSTGDGGEAINVRQMADRGPVGEVTQRETA